jgi:ankyrin repeat protein
VQLCALGADMNFENKNSQTALTLACRHAEATRAPYPTIITARDNVNGAIDQLCELGATVDFETKAGHTALGVAATAGANATVARLVDIGAFVDRASAKGMTALMLAACAQQTQTIDALFSAGANGNLIVSPGPGEQVPATLRGRAVHVDPTLIPD